MLHGEKWLIGVKGGFEEIERMPMPLFSGSDEIDRPLRRSGFAGSVMQ